ncbi:hypothetical protein IE81DRAFT_368295 [Ceraceosorus guamensis]|uniref:Trs120-domain-containing protein n=1 Tax=Ceraceosorus guamensis TaxID=1522189 RepID=A0A316VY53_9BASI|nr:hypothetical protein IE81DRAFT_368295 [Ceraceosorus guamensis]PWN40405.1 hypothetical protein IE81DRAFT_368295 [Ceraceosorus guamensis]
MRRAQSTHGPGQGHEHGHGNGHGASHSLSSQASQTSISSSHVSTPTTSTSMSGFGANLDESDSSQAVGEKSFCSPAMINILLVPAHPHVPKEEFERWSKAVKYFENVRLSDLPPSKNGARRVGSNTPLGKKGEVHISFITWYDSSHDFLSPFSVHRQVLGVLGLGTSTSDGRHRHALERAPTRLKRDHPYALSHRVWAFDIGAVRPQTMDLSSLMAAVNDQTEEEEDEDEAGSGSVRGYDLSGNSAKTSSPSTSSPSRSKRASSGGFTGRDVQDLVVFPAVRADLKDVKFYLRTLLPEFIAQVVDNLQLAVDALQGTPLETPRETLVNALGSSSGSRSGDSGYRGEGKASAGQEIMHRGPVSPTGDMGTVSSPLSIPLPHQHAPTSPGPLTSPTSATSRASAFFSSFSSSSKSTGTVDSSAASQSSSPGSSSVAGGALATAALSSASSTSASSSAISNKVRKSIKRQSVGLTGPHGLGRFSKVKADAALLCGDLWSALSGYDTALGAIGRERALAGGADAVWYAGALEGWAVARVLVRRMGGSVEEKAPASSLPGGSSTSTVKEKDKKGSEKERDGTNEKPFAGTPWADIAEAYALAIQIYSKCLAPLSYLLEPAKFVTADSPRDYTHPLIHASACLAYSRFLLAIWASGGYNGEAFDQMIYGGIPPVLAETTRPTTATYIQHSTACNIQRYEIAAPASQALTHSFAALKPADQIFILSSSASVFGCIGFARRETYLLRQMQVVLLGMFARTITDRSAAQQDRSFADRPFVSSYSDDVVRTLEIARKVCDEAYAIQPEKGAAWNVLALAQGVLDVHGISTDVPTTKHISREHFLSRYLRFDELVSDLREDDGGSEEEEEAEGPEGAAKREYLRHAAGVRASWGAQASLEGLGSSRAESISGVSLLQDEAPFGWAEQQMALLRDTIGICEMLGDETSAVFFASLLLRDFHWLLAPSEQAHLIAAIHKATQDARLERGSRTLKVKYWGPPEPVVDIEAIPIDPERKTFTRPAHEIRNGSGENAPDLLQLNAPAGLDNPFFWNHGSSGMSGNPANTESVNAAGTKMAAVCDEPCGFVVTLQNTFSVGLEIDCIKLETSGADFVPDELRGIVMPPLSTHQILLTGTPTKVGTTRARGCSIALSGCAPRSFRVLNKDAKDKVQIAQSNELDDRRLKIKATGLDARPLVLAQARMAAALQRNESSTSADVTNKKIVSTPSSKIVSCQVVDPQPLLVLQSASTPHGSLVLLDGEITTIRLQVLNAGTLPVDWIRLSFMDNLSEKMKKELNEGELNSSQAFLAEDKLLRSPVLSYSLSPRHAKHQVSPGETRELQVDVRARVGCTHLSIFADYAYVDGPGRGGLQTDEARDWYHRRLSVPLAITVLPVVELGKLEVKTLRPYEAVRTLADGLKALERAGGGLPDGLADAKLFERLLQGRPDKECLVSFPIVNAHRNNVEVVVSLKDEAYHSKLRVRRSLPQNARAQIVFPFPRLDISTEELDRPIPSLSSRQFVVPKSKSSPSEQAVARARFWLAQDIVAKLSGWRERASAVLSDGIGGANQHASLEGASTNARSSSARWIDRSTGRKGYIDLSSLMVADDHLQCLRQDPLSLSLHISAFAGGDAVQENGLVGSEEANGRLSSEKDANEGVQRTNGTLNNGVRSASKVRTELSERTLRTTAETYIDIVGTMRNESARKLRLTYRLIPIAASSSSFLSSSSDSASAFSAQQQQQPQQQQQQQSNDPLLANILVTSGNLTGNISPWPVLPDQKGHFSAGLTFLAKGQYNFIAVIEECPTFQSRGFSSDSRQHFYGAGVEAKDSHSADAAAAAAAAAARQALEMRARVQVPFKVIVDERPEG